MDNHFDRRERTIYVWMLERTVTDDQLYALFSKIGPIEKLIFKEYADGTPQHCLIVFRYVDSVLTAMSTLQGAELNGKPISLRPLRESTHAVLMPASTMYPPGKEERRMTVTSSDGLSDHSDDLHFGGGGVNKKMNKEIRSNWDDASSAGSASSCIWNGEGLESAIEKLTIDERRGGGALASRSRASFSSISSGAGSPSNSLSPPPQQMSYSASAIHGSLRKPWRPSRGPIPAPLMAPGDNFIYSRQQQQHCYPQKEEYGSGGGACAYGNYSHHSAGLAPPPSLFSQIIPPSPGYGSPSPFNGGRGYESHCSSLFGGGAGPQSPRPLFPEMYKASGTTPGPSTRPQPLSGVFSPTTAPEEVLWRPQPPPLLPSPPFTASGGGRNWFDYGEYSVPQAYRGSGKEQQIAATATDGGDQAAPPTVSLGGMLPPNSPPIGQCTRQFDFSDGSSTLPRLRPSSAHHGPPISARYYQDSFPSSPFGRGSVRGRCAPRAPRSAAPFGGHGQPSFHLNSPFAWPDNRTFGGKF